MSVSEIIKKAGNLPRYTSFPTANHFKSNICQSDVQSWIGAIDVDRPISLYFHIPYCRQLCWYCGCHTSVTNKEEKIYDYLDLVIQEMDQRLAILGRGVKGKLKVSHIHFGGGSPTIIPATRFESFMQAVRDRFDVLDTAEIAIEVDPREVTEAKVAAYAFSGVNRASFGVQDFDLGVQKAINRVQPFRTVFDAVNLFYTYGIKNINLDLIYGLPHQNTEIMVTTVEKALLMQPARISLFGYAHVPWMKSHMRLINEADLPDSLSRMKLFEIASHILTDAGYKAIGLDHFVKPEDEMALAETKGYLRRNFQGYTTDQAEVLFGFGLSSISALPMGYWQNSLDMKAYRKLVGEGKLPINKGIALSEEDQERRRLIEQVMCQYRVDLSDTSLPNGEVSSIKEDLAPLEEAGIISIEDGVVTIGIEVRQFSRIVASKFDPYLQNVGDQHGKVA